VVVTVIVVQSVAVFNDFTNPLYYLPGSKNVTVQLTLYNFQSQFNTSYNLLFMNILLITIPPLIVFLFFNRQIVAGLTAGAVKGEEVMDPCPLWVRSRRCPRPPECLLFEGPQPDPASPLSAPQRTSIRRDAHGSSAPHVGRRGRLSSFLKADLPAIRLEVVVAPIAVA